MIKEHRKTIIITEIITLLPILIGLYYWKELPDPMATHFGFDGTPNGYSSKIFGVIGLPVMCAALEALMIFVTSHDPRKKNISPKMFSLILWIIPVVSLVCSAMTYPANLGHEFNMTLAGSLFLGVVFVVMGNFLPKARQNYTIGIRVPWTLADEDNWNRTHRFAGFLWVAGGIAVILLTVFGVHSFPLMMGILIVISVLPVIYSYAISKKEE